MTTSNFMVYEESKNDQVAKDIVKWLGSSLDKWEVSCHTVLGDRDMCFERGDTKHTISHGSKVVKTESGFELHQKWSGDVIVCDSTPQPKKITTTQVVYV